MCPCSFCSGSLSGLKVTAPTTTPRYHYPDQRRVKDPDNKPMGVAGTMELLATKNLSTQPICCFDWSPDKEGLCVMGSFDQAIRVAVVTKLNKV